MWTKMLASLRAAVLAVMLAKAMHMLAALAHDVAGDLAAHYFLKGVERFAAEE